MTDTLVLLAAAFAVVWVATRPPRRPAMSSPAPVPPGLIEFRVPHPAPFPLPSAN